MWVAQASGFVNQHMGVKFWYIADDGLSHNTAQFGGPEVDQFEVLMSPSWTVRLIMLGTHSRSLWRLQVAFFFWFAVAALVGLPAAIAACLFASSRPKIKKVAALASALLALLFYWCA